MKNLLRHCHMLALLLLPLYANAQDPAGHPATPTFQPLIGQFLDPDGAPIANAEVTVAWNLKILPTLGPAGTATGRTGKRGYFAVQAPVGTILAAWALGPPDADGHAWVSAPAEATVGVQRFTIHAAEQRGSVRTLTVEGLDAWAELAPFRLQLHPCPFVDLAVELPLDEDYRVTLPLLPWHDSKYEVLTRDGQPLVLGRIPEGDSIQVGKPQTIRILSADPDGKPIGGVTIRHRIGYLQDFHRAELKSVPRPRWRVVGKTDQDGRCEIQLPQQEGLLGRYYPPPILLRGSKAGYADSHSGKLNDSWHVNGLSLKDGQTNQPLSVLMAEAEPLEGKFSLPRAQLPDRAYLTWRNRIHLGEGHSYNLRRNQTISINDDGTFALPGLPLGATELRMQVSPIRCAEGVGSGLLPITILRPQTCPLPGWDPAPDSMRRVEFQVSNADGTPCRGGRAWITLAYGYINLDEPELHLALDLAGRAAVLLPADRSKWAIAVVQGSGHASAILGPDDTKIQLRLEPFVEVPGQVTDENGQPVANARIDIASWRQDHPSTDPEPRLREAIATLAQERYVETTTDAQGMFVLRFLPVPRRSVRARAIANNKKSDIFVVMPQEAPLKLVVCQGS
ncbi:MAG: carboxypeptidase-like regulatory domain-containing protein [Planctomycetota bacterium]|nr:carboxypeptidase-like regulatory domain-containing protein [Planctomycetota bacterium]